MNDDRVTVDVEKTDKRWRVSVQGVALIVSLVAAIGAIVANCWRT